MSEDTLQVNNTSYNENQFNCKIFPLSQPTYSCQVNVANQSEETFAKNACSLFNSSGDLPTPPLGYVWSNTNIPLKSDSVRDNQDNNLVCNFTLTAIAPPPPSPTEIACNINTKGLTCDYIKSRFKYPRFTDDTNNTCGEGTTLFCNGGSIIECPANTVFDPDQEKQTCVFPRDLL